MRSKPVALAIGSLVALVPFVPAMSQTPPPAPVQVVLSQEDGDGSISCTVDPAEVAIDSGQEVEFVLGTDARASKVKIQKKKGTSTKLKFDKSPPYDVEKTKPGKTGKVTGNAGEDWVYSAVFKVKDGTNDKVICEVDPVICIKDGSGGCTTAGEVNDDE